MSDINPCFSQEIWFEILQNLPVKTLGKCGCVCKSWHSLITSPTFITTHLNNYTRNNTNTFLLYRKLSPDEVPDQAEQYLFFLESGHIPFQLSHTSIFYFKVPELNMRQCNSGFVGSIHGLLCLSDEPLLGPIRQIMLWNPFIRKMINLLPTSLAAATVDYDSDDDLGDQITTVLGFGYDSNKKDHRVVKICYSDSDHGFNPFVEMYSVSERIWKTIPSGYLADNSISSLSDSHCFLNDILHWLAWGTGPSNSLVKWVVLFDFIEETFRKIELPEAIGKMLTETPFLFEYKTKLSVLHCERFQSIGSVKCQIWVKEEEEEESWCMILNIKVDDHHLPQFGEYLGRDGKLFGFTRRSDGVSVFYDVTKRQFVELRLYYGVSSAKELATLATFTDSLVLLDHDTIIC